MCVVLDIVPDLPPCLERLPPSMMAPPDLLNARRCLYPISLLLSRYAILLRRRDRLLRSTATGRGCAVGEWVRRTTGQVNLSRTPPGSCECLIHRGDGGRAIDKTLWWSRMSSRPLKHGYSLQGCHCAILATQVRVNAECWLEVHRHL